MRVPLRLLAIALLASAVLFPVLATPSASGQSPVAVARQPVPADQPMLPETATAMVEGSTGPPVPLATLRAEAPAARISAVVLTYQGHRRAFLLITPPRLSRPLPVLLKLAGSGAPPTFEADRDGLYALAEQGRAVLAYPAELAGSWSLGVDDCCGGAARSGLDDAGFAMAVLDRVQRSLPVLNRADLVGYSAGGKLGYLLACRHADRFRSFTAVAATPLTGCPAPAKPLTFQLLVGAHDGELPITQHPEPSDQALIGAATNWLARDRCGLVVQARLLESATAFGARCAGDVGVRLVRYSLLGHSWPGATLAGPGASGLALVSNLLAGEPVTPADLPGQPAR